MYYCIYVDINYSDNNTSVNENDQIITFEDFKYIIKNTFLNNNNLMTYGSNDKSSICIDSIKQELDIKDSTTKTSMESNYFNYCSNEPIKDFYINQNKLLNSKIILKPIKSNKTNINNSTNLDIKKNYSSVKYNLYELDSTNTNYTLDNKICSQSSIQNKNLKHNMSNNNNFIEKFENKSINNNECNSSNDEETTLKNNKLNINSASLNINNIIPEGFCLIDSDKKGFIDINDLKKINKVFNYDFNDEDLEGLLEIAGKNESIISFNNFVQFLNLNE